MSNFLKPAFLLMFTLFILNGATVSGQRKTSGNAKKSRDAKTDKSVQSQEKIKAPEFGLEDQFGKTLSVKFPAEKVTVLVFGDKQGAEQIEGWVSPLYGKYTDKINIYGIAELSVVPWIAKGFVRNSIKSRSKTSIMLDWSGKVSKDYGCEKEEANLFVIDKDGYIIAENRGAATKTELENLYKKIAAVL